MKLNWTSALYYLGEWVVMPFLAFMKETHDINEIKDEVYDMVMLEMKGEGEEKDEN